MGRRALPRVLTGTTFSGWALATPGQLLRSRNTEPTLGAAGEGRGEGGVPGEAGRRAGLHAGLHGRKEAGACGLCPAPSTWGPRPVQPPVGATARGGIPWKQPELEARGAAQVRGENTAPGNPHHRQRCPSSRAATRKALAQSLPEAGTPAKGDDRRCRGGGVLCWVDADPVTVGPERDCPVLGPG